LADLPQVSDEVYSILLHHRQDKIIGTGRRVLLGAFIRRQKDGKDKTRLAVECVIGGVLVCLYL
jgi:hypothetical protein